MVHRLAPLYFLSWPLYRDAQTDHVHVHVVDAFVVLGLNSLDDVEKVSIRHWYYLVSMFDHLFSSYLRLQEPSLPTPLRAVQTPRSGSADLICI